MNFVTKPFPLIARKTGVHNGAGCFPIARYHFSIHYRSPNLNQLFLKNTNFNATRRAMTLYPNLFSFTSKYSWIVSNATLVLILVYIELVASDVRMKIQAAHDHLKNAVWACVIGRSCSLAYSPNGWSRLPNAEHILDKLGRD